MKTPENRRVFVTGGNMEQEDLINLCLSTLPDRLRQTAEPVCFKKNQIVIRKGEPTTCAYLMVLGDLTVQTEYEDGNYYTFAHILPGGYISDLEVLSGRFINAVTLVAAENSMALRFPLAVFQECLNNDIDFLRYIVYGLADAMFDTSSQRGSNLYTHSSTKVARYLLSYINAHGPEEDGVYVIRVTRQAIAAEIGINIKTVNRAVRRLSDENLLEIVHGKIRISRERVEQMNRYIGSDHKADAF